MLEQEGWQRRFIACEPRLSEAIDIYREASLEVLLEPLPEESDRDECPGSNSEEECRVCFSGQEERYRIIFVRPLKPGKGKGY